MGADVDDGLFGAESCTSPVEDLAPVERTFVNFGVWVWCQSHHSAIAQALRMVNDGGL